MNCRSFINTDSCGEVEASDRQGEELYTLLQVQYPVLFCSCSAGGTLWNRLSSAATLINTPQR